MEEKRKTRWGWGAGAAVAASALGAWWRSKPSRQSASFAGRRVLITGGSRGLGLVLARQFGARGARLLLAARDAEELENAGWELMGRGCEVHVRRCDVSDPDQVRALVEHANEVLGGIDVLVNVAGIIQVGPLEVTSREDIREALDVNFWGLVHTCYEVLPQMRARGEGRIVNVTSIGGEVAVPHLLPYSASKFAAVGFSSGLGAEVARFGVRVLTVVPGLLRTGSFVHALAKGQREREIQWFSLGASAPGLAMDARRAATRIVDACGRGDLWLTLGLPAKALRLAASLAPRLTLGASTVAARLLPRADGASPDQPAEPGWMHRTGVARSILVRMGDRAAAANNELTQTLH